VLNLGMTDDVQAALARASGSDAYAADTRRRFLEQYEKVVGSVAPAEPWEQLKRAIAAVFDSWHSDRATAYRAERGISEHGGTAVTIQAMVFGNLDELSGTGVLFSRDPTGASDEHYGEWLPRGQGEDVVSGAFDPLPVEALAEVLPGVYDELLALAQRLDRAEGVAQDIEFTVQSGKLWLLQCRRAKVAENNGPQVDSAARLTAIVLAEGRPANPGLVTGVVVTDVEDAEMRALDGEDVILARPTTNPHDVRAMAVVCGILTEIGGATSHAAVVSRELGVPCIVGCGAGALTPLNGQVVTMDAGAGVVLEGTIPVTAPARSSS
jgi:pyruvate,orthophosphate dikinase